VEVAGTILVRQDYELGDDSVPATPVKLLVWMARFPFLLKPQISPWGGKTNSPWKKGQNGGPERFAGKVLAVDCE